MMKIRNKKNISLFVVVTILIISILCIAGYLWSSRKPEINNFTKKINLPWEWGPFAIASDANEIIYYGSESIFEIDQNLNIKKLNLRFKTLISANISKNGSYLCLSFMDKELKPHTVLLDKKKERIWDIGKYLLVRFISKDGLVFCEDWGLTTERIATGSDLFSEIVTMEVYNKKGKRADKFILPNGASDSYHIQFSEDGNYINLSNLTYFGDVPEGITFDKKGERLFSDLDKLKIKTFSISPSGHYFLGYKKEDERRGKLYLISEEGKVIWSKLRETITDGVFSKNEKYILSSSFIQIKKGVKEMEVKSTYPLGTFKKIFPVYKKIKKLFLYDFDGNLLWEKRMNIDPYFELTNAITENGEFIIVLIDDPRPEVYTNSIVCLDKSGNILWETSKLELDDAFISKDGKWVYGIGAKDMYKFKNIAIK